MNESQVFEYGGVSSLATDTGEDHSAEPYDNDVIRSIELGQFRSDCANLEFHARSLYLSEDLKQLRNITQLNFVSFS